MQVRSQQSAGASRSNLLTNTNWLFAEKLIQTVAGLILSTWIARHLGPSDFGNLTFAVTYISFFYVVATFSLDALIIRDIARTPEAAHIILGSGLTIRLLGGLVAWLCALCCMLLFIPDQKNNTSLILIVGTTLFSQAFQTVDLWFQSQSRASLGVIARLIAFTLSTAIKLALLITEAPLIYFAVALAIDSILVAASLAWVYRKFRCPLSWMSTSARAIEQLRTAWPLAGSGLAITIFMKVDQLIVAGMLGKDALGIYAAATPLTQGLAFIPTTIAVVLAPTLASLRISAPISYRRKIAMLVRYTAIFALILCVALSWLSPIIITLLYGAKYEGTIPVFSVLVFNNVFVFVGLIQGIFIINESLQKLTLISTIIGATMAVLLNFLLIPEYGLLGASYATIISNFVSVTVVPLTLSRKFRSFYRNVLFYPPKISHTG